MSPDELKILVIDDNDDDRMLYRRVLQRHADTRYTISEAREGDEGLQRLAQEEPACVLLDYSLPGRNGVEVLKRIRTHHPFVPVVMLTGQGNEGIAVTAMHEGAQDYICKSGITSESLDHAIHVAVEHCALKRRIADQRASLEVFTRALAHDLKEPVRTVQSFAEIVAGGEEFTDKGRGYIEHIQRAAERMRMLIDTVFLYTSLDDPRSIERETVEVSAALEETVANLAQLIRERAAVIECGPLPRVFVNRMQLIQVLQNLLSNAIRHSSRAVTIRLTAQEEKDGWLLRVEDDGPGIDETRLQVIFQPFKRLVRDEHAGAGLGLAICKKIVESHGGRLWCESRPGAGAAFLFTLRKAPLAGASASGSATEAARSTVDPPDTERLANVLIVDDREEDVVLMRVMLFERRKVQCNLAVAAGGREALDRLRNGDGRIDLVLLDVNMPDMDGFEVLENIAKDPALARSVVVMCTGSTYDEDQRKAKALGAAGYLVKPVTFEQLEPVIADLPTIGIRKEDGVYALVTRRACSPD